MGAAQAWSLVGSIQVQSYRKSGYTPVVYVHELGSISNNCFVIRVLKCFTRLKAITVMQLLNIYIKPRRRKKLRTRGGEKCTFCYLTFFLVGFLPKP